MTSPHLSQILGILAADISDDKKIQELRQAFNRAVDMQGFAYGLIEALVDLCPDWA